MTPLATISKTAYGLALVFTGSSRQGRARARRFAAKVEATVRENTPAAIAVALNGFVIALIGTVHLREAHRSDPDAIEATLDAESFFVRTTPAPQPPSGGGGGGSPAAAVANQAAQMVMNSVPTETPKVDLTAITTPAPATFTIDAPSVSASTAQTVQKMAQTITANAQATVTQGSGNGIGTGTGSSSGTGNGSGSGTGSDSGTGNGIGRGQGTGSGETYSVAGLSLPIEEKIFIITDSSGSVRPKQLKTMEREVKKHPESSKIEERVCSMLFDTIFSMEKAVKQDYKVIVWITDLIDSKSTEDRLIYNPKNPDPDKNTVMYSAREPEVGRIYKEGVSLKRKDIEELYERAHKLLTEANVRLYIISLQEDPTPMMQQLVEATGGQISVIRNHE